jgi:hypothetical protein
MKKVDNGFKKVLTCWNDLKITIKISLAYKFRKSNMEVWPKW